MAAPSEGNEVRRHKRREVGVAHSTREAGERSLLDPVEGRGCQTTKFTEGQVTETLSSESASTQLCKIATMAETIL